MISFQQRRRVISTFIEEQTGAKVGIVSTGPDREQTIFVDAFTDALNAISKYRLR